MKTLIQSAAAALIGLTLAQGAQAAGSSAPLPEKHFSFEGVFGTFDRGALQRGFQVYSEVCAGCHGLRLVAFRNLADLGYHEEEIKAIAENYTVTAENNEGVMEERAAVPSDRFPGSSLSNAPDLSLMAKKRAHGPQYIYALMQGYEEAPADVDVPDTGYYNKYFPGGVIAMGPPLEDGYVEYADGTEATLSQMSSDLATFLMWTAEPSLEDRKQMGIKVIIFLLIFTGVLYAAKRKIWAAVH